MSVIGDLVELLVPIACGCILPIVAIWLCVRRKMNETNKRTEIVLAAIEKNPEMDIEELLKKITPKPKLLKEKLLSKLHWGCLTLLLGIGMLGCELYLKLSTISSSPMGIAGIVLLAVGVACLTSYHMGKKMLAKEIEAEEQQVIAQAEGR
ncbi:MAG: hypothetical protein IKQ12_06755 [Prevotella sp.]|nr:hypothetical protein [Prevotella sp.]